MNFIGTTLSVYVVLAAAAFVMQRSLLYPGAKDAPDAARYGVPGIEEVATRTSDGHTLTHWYRPPAAEDLPVLVVFHGNAGHLGDRVPKLAALLRTGYGMLLAGYRGYGGNPGRPSEEALTEDARILMDWLAARGVPPARTVLYGESLGTGIAVKMAAERDVGAVILESPYTSIAEIAQVHYWYFPAKWMILDRWNSISRIEGVRAPLLIVHGARDRTVPPRFGRRLFEAAPEPKEFLYLEEAAHNDLYEFPQVPARVIEFLNRHVPTAG